MGRDALDAGVERRRLFFFFSQRMRGIIDTVQRVHIQMCVALGGGNAAVAQQFLHSPQVCAAFQQMCGEGVPHIVRGNVLGYAGELGVFFKDACGLPAVQPLAAPAEEQRPFPENGRYLRPHFQPAGQSRQASRCAPARR